MTTTHVLPVTPGRWEELERFFESPGPRGGTPIVGSCWCAFARGLQQCGRAVRKQALREQIAADERPGLLAYRDGQPVGWLALGRRDVMEGIRRSRTLRPAAPDPDVMAIVCLYVDPDERGQGVSSAMIDAAIDYARAEACTSIEAYAKADLARHAAAGGRAEQAFSYMGRRAQYEARGFRVVREAGARLVMSRAL